MAMIWGNGELGGAEHGYGIWIGVLVANAVLRAIRARGRQNQVICG